MDLAAHPSLFILLTLTSLPVAMAPQDLLDVDYSDSSDEDQESEYDSSEDLHIAQDNPELQPVLARVLKDARSSDRVTRYKLEESLSRIDPPLLRDRLIDFLNHTTTTVARPRASLPIASTDFIQSTDTHEDFETLWQDFVNAESALTGLDKAELVKPSGDFSKPILVMLHYPSFRTAFRKNGMAADASNPCTNLILKTGFNEGNSFWLEENFRRMTPPKLRSCPHASLPRAVRLLVDKFSRLLEETLSSSCRSSI